MKQFDKMQKIKGQLIVSCQALKGEPLYGFGIMAKLALAAKDGGAAGIRANSIEDIIEIKKTIKLPIIGIIKKEYKDSDVYITPTFEEVQSLHDLGVDIIAVDFTSRIRPSGVTLEEFAEKIMKAYPDQLFMADISTFEEGIRAAELGMDLLSTTLSGYTSYSKNIEGPDLELVSKLSKAVNIPVICEGKIHSPNEAKAAIESGAYAVVVGGAITRPLEITKRFVMGMR